MSQKDYPKKAKPCPAGINCCGCGQFGPRKSKRKSRRYARHVSAQQVEKDIGVCPRCAVRGCDLSCEEDSSDWDAHVSPYGFGK